MKFDGVLLDTATPPIRKHLASLGLAGSTPPGRERIRPSGVDLSSMNEHEFGFDVLRSRIESALAAQSITVLDWHGRTLIVVTPGIHDDVLQGLGACWADKLIRTYRNADTNSPFNVAFFGDYDGEADVCWHVARGSDPAVRVLCEFSEYGDWWRPTTARAKPIHCEATRHCSGLNDFVVSNDAVVHVVYEVDSFEMLRALWSRTSYDDRAAVVCASVSVDVNTLIQSRAIWPHGRELSLLRSNDDWIYTQRYGGGAGEHYAIFAAVQPQLAERAYRYAADRNRSGKGQWWLAGMA